MVYWHRFVSGNRAGWPPGKIVCVGRNYAAHAEELGNPLPEKPLLFIKPSTALVALEQELKLPGYGGNCQHEVELALLIGKQLDGRTVAIGPRAIAGYAIALDLTLRQLQTRLRAQGHPWEIAKAFDGACPISPFVDPEELADAINISLRLEVNGVMRQQGHSGQMLTGIHPLIRYICRFFTLLPGDVVLTGTPAGVADLHPGDQIRLTLAERFHFVTKVNPTLAADSMESEWLQGNYREGDTEDE